MTTAVKQLRLPPMPRISDIIRLYGLRAKKELSQNFIMDLNITDKIARKSDVFDCHVIEVGSGPGSLTRSLLNNGVRHLHAVELDKRFLPSLQILEDASQGHMTIHHADIMEFDCKNVLARDNIIGKDWENQETPNVRLVGNLPFAVSIPLLLQWLEAVSNKCGPFHFGRIPMSLVFQKEVGENLVAEVFSNDRTRMSVMAQNYCHVSKAMHLSSEVFVPQPKIEAWLVNLTPRKEAIIDAPFDIVEQVVKAVFSSRRKVIRTPLRRLFPGKEKLADYLLDRANVDPTLRPYQLTLLQFREITRTFMKICAERKMPFTPLSVNKPIAVK